MSDIMYVIVYTIGVLIGMAIDGLIVGGAIFLILTYLAGMTVSFTACFVILAFISLLVKALK